MTVGPDLIGEAGVQFFGRMSASISHELKNVLATIKENSGLLNDYLDMMAKGAPIDPERFRTVARRIETQTGRADTIIKDLNRFAHTADHSASQVDLNQMLVLLVALHNRLAAMRQVTLEPRPADAPVLITTAPFVLLNALGLQLALALPAVPADGTMTISVTKSETTAEICFGRLTALTTRTADPAVDAQAGVLLAALGAQAQKDAPQSRIIVALPLTG